jgi:DNA-binding NarL/FixJ family response regulator
MGSVVDLADDILATIAREALGAGLAEDASRQLARRCLCSIQDRWGCGSHYLRARDRSERDAEVLAALSRGERIATVARAVGVTERTVRRIRAKRERDGWAPDEWCL